MEEGQVVVTQAERSGELTSDIGVPTSKKTLWELICESVAHLANIGSSFAVNLPDMKKRLQEVEVFHKEILEEVKYMEFPPEKQAEIHILKREFNDCIITAKEFLLLCANMAKFCLNKDLIEAIDNELPQEVDNLLKFIVKFYEYFEDCQTKLEEFEKQHDDAQYGARQTMQEHVERKEKSEAEFRSAQNQHAAHYLDPRSSLAHNLSKLALGETAKGDLPSDTATVLAGFFTSINIVAHLHEWNRAKSMYNETQNMQEKARIKEMSERSIKAIYELQSSLLVLQEDVKRTWSHAKVASIQVKGLKTYDVRNMPELNAIDTADINTKLGSLRASMKTILITLGNDGENVVSGVTTTQPFQASTSGSLQEAEAGTTLSLPSKQTIGSSYKSDTMPIANSIEAESTADRALLLLPSTQQKKMQDESSSKEYADQ